jgi:hypothetical protein
MTSYHNSIYTSGQELKVYDVDLISDLTSPIDGNDFRVDGAGFYITETLKVQFFKDVKIKGLTGRYGGAIYLDPSPNSLFSLKAMSSSQFDNKDITDNSASVEFTDMEITDCKAEFDGGAFYLANPINATITSSVIKNCKAGTTEDADGEGGAIYFGCTLE